MHHTILKMINLFFCCCFSKAEIKNGWNYKSVIMSIIQVAYLIVFGLLAVFEKNPTWELTARKIQN